MSINTAGIETDISRETARRAYQGTSFRSEARGDCVVDSYIGTMTNLARFVEQNDHNGRGQEVFDKLREGYKKRTLAHISAQSRCISTMIAGPANFPVRRAEKANASERRRSEEWLAFHNKLEEYALKGLKPIKEPTGENISEEFKGFSVIRNKDEDRLQLVFDDKPSEETRSLLKSNGFRWSPRFTAWQRQLTNNAERTLTRIKEKLEG